jgi:hypothetical protein
MFHTHTKLRVKFRFYSQCRHVLSHEKTFMQYVYICVCVFVFIVCLYTKCHMPVSSGSLFMTVRPKAINSVRISCSCLTVLKEVIFEVTLL